MQTKWTRAPATKMKWMTRELLPSDASRQSPYLPSDEPPHTRLIPEIPRNTPQIDYLPTLAPLSPLSFMHSKSLGVIQTLPTDVCPAPSTMATPPRQDSDTASLRGFPSVESTRSLHRIKSKDKTTSSDIAQTSLMCAAKTCSQRLSKKNRRLSH